MGGHGCGTRFPEVVGRIVDEKGDEQALHRGPLQHESLTPDQLRRIGRLRDVLVDAYPMTLDGWVDGFMRDANPESEIRIIEACAAVYQRLASRAAALRPEEKQRLYSVLCAVSTGASGPALAAAVPAGRGLPDLAGLAAMFEEAWRTGERP